MVHQIGEAIVNCHTGMMASRGWKVAIEISLAKRVKNEMHWSVEYAVCNVDRLDNVRCTAAKSIRPEASSGRAHLRK